jgi:hypothetical protein
VTQEPQAGLSSTVGIQQFYISVARDMLPSFFLATYVTREGVVATRIVSQIVDEMR